VAGGFESLRRRVTTAVELATARADELRARSTIVDRAFGVLNRERLIATSVLSAFVAFRTFVFLIPYVYVVVAGLGLYGSSHPGGTRGFLQGVGISRLLASSLSNALEASDRSRWLALILGSGAMLWASLGLTKSVFAVHLVAWRLPRTRMRTTVAAVLAPVVLITAAVLVSGVAAALRERGPLWVVLASVGVFIANTGLWLLTSLGLPRDRQAPWTALLPGAALLAVGLQAVHVAVVFYFAGRVTRASETYGALGVALVVLAWLFLIGRLTVAAADVNAALWEQRAARRAAAASHLRIDPDGRVSIPREVRDAWGIDAGDELVIERDGDWVRLAPARRPESSPSEPRTPRR
jgi:AbrB family looped-hinge helix DNA binding protein